VLELQQEEKPISIAGTVYHDTDLDLSQDAGEAGIAGVTLDLWKKDASGNFVNTGHSTTTDANGDYEFGTGLDLKPGTYQVRETQPSGYFSVGAMPGTVEGATVGTTVAGNKERLTEITIPKGDQHAVDYDFAEALPASISGYVYHDKDNDGLREAGEFGLPGELVHVIPIDTIAPQSTIIVATDASGFYQADHLAPGTYRVIEVLQPLGYLDGLDAAGSVDGSVRGVAVNPGDEINAIQLLGGDDGVDARDVRHEAPLRRDLAGGGGRPVLEGGRAEGVGPGHRDVLDGAARVVHHPGAEGDHVARPDAGGAALDAQLGAREGRHVVDDAPVHAVDVGGDLDRAGAVGRDVAEDVHGGDLRVGRAPDDRGLRPLAPVGVHRASPVGQGRSGVEAPRLRRDLDAVDPGPAHRDGNPEGEGLGARPRRGSDQLVLAHGQGPDLAAPDPEGVPGADQPHRRVHDTARSVQGDDLDRRCLAHPERQPVGGGPEADRLGGVLGEQGKGGRDAAQGGDGPEEEGPDERTGARGAVHGVHRLHHMTPVVF